MKNILKTSAVIMGLMLGLSGGAVSASAVCPYDIQTFVCNGNCNLGDIKCLTGNCSYDDIKELIGKLGILPDNEQCTDCNEENNAVPVTNEDNEQCTDCKDESNASVETNDLNDVTGEEVKTSEPVQESSSVSEYEQKVVDLVNDIRVKNGLSALKLNNKLSEVARMKSQDMKDKRYFSHNSPTYGSPFDMMKQFGISYRTAGENIAMGQQTPEIVVNAWMNSEGHRANILNASFKEIGVGYVSDGNYWTQMFIG